VTESGAIHVPLDAITLKAVVSELNEALIGAKVDKIHQPDQQTAVLSLRLPRGAARLLVSTGASPRICLTGEKIENPTSPPMFCMLLRKHLTGAKIRAFSQPGLERIVHIEFDTLDELGDPSKRTLTAELIGRQANLILQGADGRIIDCVRRVDLSARERRQVLPGMFYRPPESRGRVDFRTISRQELRSVLQPLDGGVPDEKRLSSLFMGLSPLVARELLFRASEKGGDQLDALIDELSELSERIGRDAFSPVMLVKADGVAPLDYSFMEISQYGSAVLQKRCRSFSEMLDEFYLEKERAERRKKRFHELNRLVSTAQERKARKLALQEEEYMRATDREKLKKYGDLLMAGLHLAEKGVDKVRLPDFYVEGAPEIEVPLDKKLSPQQNAQRYYKNYSRMKNAEAALKMQIGQTERELLYLESVADELERAETASELQDIREELLQSGYLKDKAPKKTAKKPASFCTRPFEYRTSDGFPVLAGRNNRQNEELTLKTAAKGDLWFHTQKIPGSHVILVCDGKTPSDKAKSEAAMIAAYHSRASASARVPVDYTQVRFVKKLPGGKCGMVTYKNFETAIVTPDEKIIGKLKK